MLSPISFALVSADSRGNTGTPAEGLNSDFEENLNAIVRREWNATIGNFLMRALLQHRSINGIFTTDEILIKNEGDFFYLKGFLFNQIGGFPYNPL